MDWATILRQFILPLLLKLLQGIASLPAEQQAQLFEAMTAPQSGDGVAGYTPQPGEQYPDNPNVDALNANVGRET